jgi:serine/threonine protein kinase/WD40 repeat protein
MAAERVGQQLGNYRLLRLLGEGGFAQVYLGEHLYLKTQAAIKVLHARLGKADLDDFLSEAQTIARLKHPHILRVLDFGVEGSTPFLVMEYAPNGTLRERHPKGQQLSLQAILPYVRQVAGALHHAHEQRLIHRDVKPENMLLSERDEVLLSDFGIAIAAQSSQMQEPGVVAGTVSYMAPEQLQGRPRPASDQYALGVVVYEWLAGRRPFLGSFSEVASQHLLAPPPPLRDFTPALSPAVEQVVLIALAKDPKERFKNVLAFAHALEEASQATAGMLPLAPPSGQLSAGATQPSLLFAPTQITPSDPPGPLADAPTRLPPADPPTAQAATLVPTWQPTTLTPALPPVRPSAPLEMTQPPVPPPEAPAAPAATVLEATAPAPDAVAPAPARSGGLSRRAVIAGLAGLAVVGGAGATLALSQRLPSLSKAPPRPTARPTLTPTPTPVPNHLLTYRGHTQAVNSVAWSPDGTRIASASSDRTVQIWKATDGTLIRTYTGHSSVVWSVAWMPNSSTIASSSDDGSVQVWDADSGTLLHSRQTPSAVISIAWSPKGRYLVYGNQEKPSTFFQVWDTASDRLATSHQSPGFGEPPRAAWSPDGQSIVSNNTLEVWNAFSGTPIFPVLPTLATNAGIYSVAWSPDGSTILGGGYSIISAWKAADGSFFSAYSIGSGQIIFIAWSPNGQSVVSASSGTPVGNNVVEVWHPSNNGINSAPSYVGHTDAVYGAAWSPDSTRVASASADRTVQIWLAHG